MISASYMYKHPVIAVCGAGTADAQLDELAEEVGRRIAEAGAMLICGGLGGVMEAACRGAVQAGGMTVGVLPGDSRRAANAFVQVPVATNMGHARNVIIVQTADVVIAIGGSYGTLSEIALARKCGRSVIGLHTWNLDAGSNEQVHVHPAYSPAEAVALALREVGA
jgi:hypothetical protein